MPPPPFFRKVLVCTERTSLSRFFFCRLTVMKEEIEAKAFVATHFCGSGGDEPRAAGRLLTRSRCVRFRFTTASPWVLSCDECYVSIFENPVLLRN